MWTCDEVCRALYFLLDNIYVRFGNTLFKQIIGIPMGTNCAHLIADLSLDCYERDFMLSLSEDKQQDVIVAFNNTSRYLDYIFNLDNSYFDQMVYGLYSMNYNLIKRNLEILVHITINTNSIYTKIYDKRDDFDF
jgi:hypothetical protein